MMSELNHNQQIKEYVKQYLNGSDPGYAIMIDGPWGVGKTFFIKEIIKDLEQKFDFISISMNGVSSVDGIERQIISALYPVLTNSAFKLLTKAAFVAAQATLKTNLTELLGDSIKDLELPKVDFKKYNEQAALSKVLIVDDIERSKMSIAQVLGYINHLVEHQGQKVILCCNLSELEESDVLIKISEKTIGRTFKITPETELAYEEFLKRFASMEVGQFFVSNSDQILAYFKQLKLQNLRTLKFALSEFSKFYDYIPERARKNSEFVFVCFQSVFVLSLMKDSPSTDDSEFRKQMREVSQDQYNDYQIVPSPNVLRSFKDTGYVPESLMEEAIRASSYFADENTPEWIRLWYYMEITPELYEKSISEVEEKINKFVYTHPNQIKHILGIYIRLSEVGALDSTEKNIKDKIILYINELSKKDLLVFEGFNTMSPYNDSAYGLQFLSMGNSAFVEVDKLLVNLSKKKFEANRKRDAGAMPGMVKNDISKFLNLINPQNGNGAYHYSPIFDLVDVDDFFEALITIHPLGLKELVAVLDKRYSNRNKAFLPEIEFWLSVGRLISRHAPKFEKPLNASFSRFGSGLLELARDFERIHEAK